MSNLAAPIFVLLLHAGTWELGRKDNLYRNVAVLKRAKVCTWRYPSTLFMAKQLAHFCSAMWQLWSTPRCELGRIFMSELSQIYTDC